MVALHLNSGAPMHTCRMLKSDGRACGQPIFICSTCSASGCKNNDCRNQQFRSSFAYCFACGATWGIRTR